MSMANSDCVGQNGLCKNESPGEYNHELFCVTRNDSDYIDIEDLY